MSSINRQPTGFLGFLGIKNFGRAPATTGDVLAPTWDLRDWYLAQSRLYIQQTVAVNATGNYLSFTCPPGLAWYVHAMGLASDALAGAATLDGGLVMFNTNNTAVIPISDTLRQLPTAGNGIQISLGRPIIIASGEGLGFKITRYTAGPTNVYPSICYTPMDA